jgi:hypothetical protein
MLHRSLAEGVYRDISTRSANYYYYLGKTLSWADEQNAPYPLDTFDYELEARSEIITMKQINPTDVSFVIPRKNWVANEVYDMYDDRLGDEVIGIDIVDGGSGFTSLPTLTISGGGGSGANYSPIIFDNQIIGVDRLATGSGYTSTPTVTITGGGGSGAVLKAVVNIAANGGQKLEDTDFYVMTDDFNVYKCLDNNNGALSTDKPLGTQIDPIKTDDGYVWKYMYNVPINLRNKFLTEDQMPVVSALTNQFYSNGTCDTIVINNKGAGYTTATITVVGDGYLAADPTYLTSVIVSEGGSNYSSPMITFGDPVSDASEFIANSSVYLGQRIYIVDGDDLPKDFYEVVSPGTLSAIGPTHRSGIVTNGSTALKYIGTRVRGTPVVTGDELTGINLIGSVREVQVINPGSGYTTVPTITFSGGGGSGAIAVPKMNETDGSVLYVTVTNAGDDYTSTPTVTFGDEWEASTSYDVGDQIYYSNRLYTVTVSGTSGTTAPTHTSGDATNGNTTLEYAGTPATGTVVRRFGAGYSAAPAITITEPGTGGSGAVASFLTTKSEARLLPVIEDGQIVGVTVVDAGVGYSAATITVTGDGDGCEMTAELSVGNIQSLQANNEILTPKGTINAIPVISGGYGYGVANIEVHGDGSGCVAEAVIDNASGRITKINVTNPGEGYTFADIVIDGNGQAAELRAILPPYGGHGKNSPEELFARTLMFYSNVSTDLNQGVPVNNDYRQLGIIKNPKAYNSDQKYNQKLGSGCFIIEANINTANFDADDDIYIERISDTFTDDNGDPLVFQRMFRVVSVSSTYALLQSLDNDQPNINDIFVKVVDSGTAPTFTATSVGLPTVDKYSGQLMFIDNKAGFTPSEDETVTLRTVLKF